MIQFSSIASSVLIVSVCFAAPALLTKTASAQEKEYQCKADLHEYKRWYKGDKKNAWYKWMKGNWEFQVAEKYGSTYARFDNADKSYLSCKQTSTGFSCVIRGKPCALVGEDSANKTKCYDKYTYSIDLSKTQLSYDQMWANWSTNMRRRYGIEYSYIGLAKNTRTGQYRTLESTILKARIPTTIRFVEGIPCRSDK